MILPDSRCEVHGETLALYHTVNRGRPIAKTYCRSCRNEYERAKRNSPQPHHSPLSPRCRRGHPKTPFNHRRYGGIVRCVPCAREQGRLKR